MNFNRMVHFILLYIKTNTLFAIFWPRGLYRAKKNENNDNLCKIHVGLYIASALPARGSTQVLLCLFHGVLCL